MQEGYQAEQQVPFHIKASHGSHFDPFSFNNLSHIDIATISKTILFPIAPLSEELVVLMGKKTFHENHVT